MPELPDLVVIEERLSALVGGATIRSAVVKQPVVVRNQSGGPFEAAVSGAVLAAPRRVGPFLHFALDEESGARRFELVIHPMLAGRFGFENESTKVKKSGLCFSLATERGTLHYLDSKKMGKVYLVPPERFDLVPRFREQGVDLLSSDFTQARFRELIDKSRKQVRVFLMDQTALSSIGNAYADEILFAAGLHPKTFCYALSEAERDRLFEAIGTVLQWGIAEVAAAQRPLEEKVRDHMRVRNRKDQPCPRCGNKIRRAAVLGHDAFFCPVCQPPARDQFIDWRGAS